MSVILASGIVPESSSDAFNEVKLAPDTAGEHQLIVQRVY